MDNDLFKNKYQIKSTRLKNWDYSNPGYYFITVCTKNFINYFGEIKNKRMQLSSAGKIANNEIKKTIEIRNNISIDDYIIMPNHIHMIVILNQCRDALQCVSTNKFGPQKNNLSSIVRGFKSSVKRNCNVQNLNFSWQSRFWEHIIRNEKSYIEIQKYIQNNPIKWELDKYYA